MKKILKSPTVMVATLISLFFGIKIVSLMYKDILFTDLLTMLPLRYTIILLNLFVDYLVFENINNYMLIFRYRSIQNFLLKSTMMESLVTFILFFSFSLPILLIPTSNASILSVILFIFNGVLVVSVFLSVIRFLNIWIANRFISTTLFVIVFVIIDAALDQIAFAKGLMTMFTFNDILAMPLKSGVWYPFIFMSMILFTLLMIYQTQMTMSKRDYILKNDVDDT